MIKRMFKLIKIPSVILAAALMAACAGSKSVPMVIQSDPLGAHVVIQVHSSVKGTSKEWAYLGKTPLDIKRNIRSKQLRKAHAFRLKMMKDGHSDQIRDWNGKEIKTEIKEKGHLFWNPKMVPSS